MASKRNKRSPILKVGMSTFSTLSKGVGALGRCSRRNHHKASRKSRAIPSWKVHETAALLWMSVISIIEVWGRPQEKAVGHLPVEERGSKAEEEH